MSLSHYIKDLVYGASDGIITTFAVVAGMVGAGIDNPTNSAILIIGIASLLADGFSMATSDFLASKSERDMFENEKLNVPSADQTPFYNGVATFIAFVLAGFLPLLPYFFLSANANRFLWAIGSTAFALFIVGGFRSLATGKHPLYTGVETLLVGGIAASIAYGAGVIIDALVS
jgi:VIT1/CCC1 family predicted Fe2+/Mn2+ transporter